MTIDEILDRVKAEYGLTSDYQLAKKLSVSCSRIGNYRSGRSTMDDELILNVENLLDLPPGSLLLEMHAERTKCAEAKKIFHEMSQKLMSTAAAIFLAISISYSAIHSADVSASPSGSDASMYIMLNYVLRSYSCYPLGCSTTKSTKTIHNKY